MSPCLWSSPSAARSLHSGGDDGIRTHDPLLAGQVLSQLSYTPSGCTPGGSPHRGCRRRPIFPCRLRQSIVSTAQLNFRVRNGNGWTLCVCDTDFSRTWSLKIEQQNPSIKIPSRFRLYLEYAAPPSGRRHVLHRKEVIQPHLPIRLPCYDLTPIIEPTFDCCPLAVSSQASGVSNFHGLTGGVYKTRERIHRGMLIRDY